MRFLEIDPDLLPGGVHKFPVAINLEHVLCLTRVDGDTTAVVDVRGGSLTVAVPYEELLSYFGNVAVLD